MLFQNTSIFKVSNIELCIGPRPSHPILQLYKHLYLEELTFRGTGISQQQHVDVPSPERASLLPLPGAAEQQTCHRPPNVFDAVVGGPLDGRGD